jgi:hypothetical protein
MKKTILLLSLLISTFSIGQTTKNALDYMNVISAEFKAIQSATWDYTRSAAKNKSARKIEKNRIELIQTISSSITKVKKMPEYKGEGYYRDSILSFLEMNKAVVSEDYEKIMNLEEIAEQSYDYMEAYLLAQKVASDKLHEAGERVDSVEQQFAKENNINLIKGEGDKVSVKLKKAGEVYAYYNPVYLIYFKSYKQEIYLLDALKKGDVSAMEQNRSMLEKTAEEGLKQLAKIKAFNGDESLKKAAIDMLTFYLDEAKNKIQTLIDFQTTIEGFEKAKATMESTKPKDRTQDDIDEYNKLVGEYNSGSAKYNKVNEELNNKRSKCIDNWNKTADNFTSKHVG